MGEASHVDPKTQKPVLETKCWFRRDDDGRQTNVSLFISGAKSCAPPNQSAIVAGNKDCWTSEGFNYDTCCHHRVGVGGNPQCWDDMFNYDRCCLPDLDLI